MRIDWSGVFIALIGALGIALGQLISKRGTRRSAAAESAAIAVDSLEKITKSQREELDHFTADNKRLRAEKRDAELDYEKRIASLREEVESRRAETQALRDVILEQVRHAADKAEQLMTQADPKGNQ